MATYKAPIIRLMMVKESNMEAPRCVTGPHDIGVALVNKYGMADRELMGVVLLDTKHHVLAIDVVAMGALNCTHVTMRELFKSAILSNARSVILWHNHPSGVTTPSPEDITITHAIRQAGDLLDITVLDHIVVGQDGYTSIKQAVGF